MRRAALLIAAVPVLAGCGSEAPERAAPAPPSTSAPSTPTSTPTSGPVTSGPATPGPASPKPGTKVIVADSKYGPMLYDASGQPIYLFDKERGTEPDCYGDCAKAWPPVLTDGQPVPAKGARASLLGTTKRKDGRTQVTYAGHPLYFYAHEGKYQVLCHDVTEYGGTWLVVRPDGTPAPD